MEWLNTAPAIMVLAAWTLLAPFTLLVFCINPVSANTVSVNEFQKLLNDFNIVQSKLSQMEGLPVRVAALKKLVSTQEKHLSSQKRQIVSLRRLLTIRDPSLEDGRSSARDSLLADHDNSSARNMNMPKANRRALVEGNQRGIRAAVGIAFTAVLTSNLQHLGIGQTIRFDRVLLNDGNGYNEHSGTFTAPVSGVYLFAYHFDHFITTGQVWLELMVNGVKQNAGASDSFHSYQDVQGGNLAIIRLVAGDDVWVETWQQNDASLHGDRWFTSWSGVLLY